MAVNAPPLEDTPSAAPVRLDPDLPVANVFELYGQSEEVVAPTPRCAPNRLAVLRAYLQDGRERGADRRETRRWIAAGASAFSRGARTALLQCRQAFATHLSPARAGAILAVAAVAFIFVQAQGGAPDGAEAARPSGELAAASVPAAAATTEVARRESAHSRNDQRRRAGEERQANRDRAGAASAGNDKAREHADDWKAAEPAAPIEAAPAPEPAPAPPPPPLLLRRRSRRHRRPEAATSSDSRDELDDFGQGNTVRARVRTLRRS